MQFFGFNCFPVDWVRGRIFFNWPMVYPIMKLLELYSYEFLSLKTRSKCVDSFLAQTKHGPLWMHTSKFWCRPSNHCHIWNANRSDFSLPCRLYSLILLLLDNFCSAISWFSFCQMVNSELVPRHLKNYWSLMFTVAARGGLCAHWIIKFQISLWVKCYQYTYQWMPHTGHNTDPTHYQHRKTRNILKLDSFTWSVPQMSTTMNMNHWTVMLTKKSV